MGSRKMDAVFTTCSYVSVSKRFPDASWVMYHRHSIHRNLRIYCTQKGAQLSPKNIMRL